ncbi:hypothetical protein L3X38_038391 [Prunus dulcis]|uniref:Uncharacterized protein n=1 Tax=Prunus dulcis TaxID=3755 RepID=A0AAD4YS49_PRUDU|nr:hypothetical protein L3X38_038391 [Prunus dulcis]
MQSTDHVAVDWAAFTVRVPEIFAFSVNRPYNHPKTPDGQFTSTVDMKERNSTSTLKRILVTCAAQAKEYGGCVAAKLHAKRAARKGLNSKRDSSVLGHSSWNCSKKALRLV